MTFDRSLQIILFSVTDSVLCQFLDAVANQLLGDLLVLE